MLDLILDIAPSGFAAPFALVLFAAGAALVAWPYFQRVESRDGVRKRLHAKPAKAAGEAERHDAAAHERVMREKMLRKANDFYAKTDPENVARIRQKLIRAGYFDPGAVGLYFVVRFACLGIGTVLALTAGAFGSGIGSLDTWLMSAIVGILCYFAPNVYLSHRTRQKLTEYRNGFPDFMDLMVVCSDAGISMEASVERVSRELIGTHPSLAQNLQLVSIELRAGRSLDDALKALAERLGVEEVRAFATLLQQSRELGTSLSGALRVFSDEMRHKRMAAAEEKAHALPAKMSVPVTMCILPVVLLVAIIPVIVRVSTGNFN
ncbi:MAG: type II secretion system F family protein [Brucellaceae bacterium]|nr:type II secretion system F family protein [Brucellaceae bacterium]